MLTPMNRAGGLPANLELRMVNVGRLVGGQDYRVCNLEEGLCGKALAEREVKIGGPSLFLRTIGSKALIGRTMQEPGLATPSKGETHEIASDIENC